MLLPISTASTLLFSGVMGLLWLSTIPPTSALVAIMFGQRWLTMLLGLASAAINLPIVEQPVARPAAVAA